MSKRYEIVRNYKWLILPLFLLSAITAAFSMAASTQAEMRASTVSVALPRIIVNNQGGFSKVGGRTPQPVKLRGANYVRLAEGPNGSSYHSTFEPLKYDHNAAVAMFQQMKRDGYNVVRVFIDPGVTDANNAHGIGRGNGTSGYIYDPYMQNFVKFAKAASEHGIYVIPVLDAFPQNDTYRQTIQDTIRGEGVGNMGGRNIQYLNKGYVKAKAEYMKQFAQSFKKMTNGQYSTVIAAYQTDNEVYFEDTAAPYNTMSGTVKPVNGVTYDMSSPAQRQQSADASLVEYVRQLKESLRQADSEALMTIGFFTNYAVGKQSFNGFIRPANNQDGRFPGRAAAVSRSPIAGVDFIDMHVYKNTLNYDVNADLATSERNLFAKPFMIGEMGTLRSLYNNDVTRGAYAMRDLQIATCKQGAQGWAYWTWNTTENLASQPLFFNMMESRGALNGLQAPVVRPDPCK